MSLKTQNIAILFKSFLFLMSKKYIIILALIDF